MSASRLTRARVDLRAGGDPQRAGESGGSLTVLGTQVGVAGAHRQTIGFAHGRQHLDPHREVEVAGHATDDRRLLSILLAEVGDLRLD